MYLELKGLTKNGNAAIYTGAAAQVRISVKAFPGGVPCDHIGISDGCLAEAKAPLTKEERKAANAAKPKPTLTERVQKEEARLARMKAKLNQ